MTSTMAWAIFWIYILGIVVIQYGAASEGEDDPWTVAITSYGWPLWLVMGLLLAPFWLAKSLKK